MNIIQMLLIPPPADDVFPRTLHMRYILLVAILLLVSCSYFYTPWMFRHPGDSTIWRWHYPGLMPLGIIIFIVFLAALYRWIKTGACGAMLLTFFMALGLTQPSSMGIESALRSLL